MRLIGEAITVDGRKRLHYLKSAAATEMSSMQMYSLQVLQEKCHEILLCARKKLEYHIATTVHLLRQLQSRETHENSRRDLLQ